MYVKEHLTTCTCVVVFAYIRLQIICAPISHKFIIYFHINLLDNYYLL